MTVFSKAVIVKPLSTDNIVQLALLATRLDMFLFKAERSKLCAAFYIRASNGPVFGVNINNTTGSSTIQRRGRATDNFHAFYRANVDVINLALAIGSGIGNAIHINFYAANTKIGDTKSTNGNT